MRQRGITLIELVMVIVALTAGVAFLGYAFIGPAQSLSQNENMQIAWQVAQACADHALGQGRALYSNIAVGMANPCPTLSGVTPTFTVTDISGSGPCSGVAGSGVCRNVAITATKSGYTASINFMIANY